MRARECVWPEKAEKSDQKEMLHVSRFARKKQQRVENREKYHYVNHR
jgi:hypothetical protein